MNLILPFKAQLNAQAYGHMIQEFNVELVEMYSELYDLRTEDINNGTVKRTKTKLLQINELARNCIDCAQEVTKVIYAVDEDSKYDYLQAVLNMELQCASKYSKLLENDPEAMIKNLQLSMDSYGKARKFIDGYKRVKKLNSDADLTE